MNRPRQLLLFAILLMQCDGPAKVSEHTNVLINPTNRLRFFSAEA